MASLSILISVTVLPLLVTAWALARSARAAGSSRGQFRVGLIVGLLLLILGVVFAVIGAIVPHSVPVPGLVMEFAILIAQLASMFFVLRFTFKLSATRTFVPFGVYLALVFAQLALVFFIIKPFVAEAFVIPTKSMSPTIDPGDRFVVNKLTRVRRLDLVTYWSQEAHPAIYCKRLIGLPGERIRFDQGGIFINDQPLALPSVLAGRCHASPSVLPPNRARYRDGESIALGKDEYFFVGDNIDVCIDSRLAGPSPASSVVGAVVFLYWPLSKARLLR